MLALCRAKAGIPQTALALIEKAEYLVAPAGDLDSQLYKVRTLELVGDVTRLSLPLPPVQKRRY